MTSPEAPDRRRLTEMIAELLIAEQDLLNTPIDERTPQDHLDLRRRKQVVFIELARVHAHSGDTHAQTQAQTVADQAAAEADHWLERIGQQGGERT